MYLIFNFLFFLNTFLLNSHQIRIHQSQQKNQISINDQIDEMIKNNKTTNDLELSNKVVSYCNWII